MRKLDFCRLISNFVSDVNMHHSSGEREPANLLLLIKSEVAREKKFLKNLCGKERDVDNESDLCECDFRVQN
jgi:hypothetical protein